MVSGGTAHLDAESQDGSLKCYVSSCSPTAKALAFFKESPEYSDKMTITDKYNTHFASQYREKVGRHLLVAF